MGTVAAYGLFLMVLGILPSSSWHYSLTMHGIVTCDYGVTSHLQNAGGYSLSCRRAIVLCMGVRMCTCCFAS